MNAVILVVIGVVPRARIRSRIRSIIRINIRGDFGLFFSSLRRAFSRPLSHEAHPLASDQI